MKLATNVRLSITDDCNRLCPECPSEGWYAKKRSDKESHYIRMDDLITFLKHEYQVINMVITGGEPTLHPELSKLLDWASPNSEKILLETNGFHLDLLDNYPNLRILLPIYEDESLEFKLNQIHCSKNTVVLQTFKNHPDFERAHRFAVDNNLNEFVSAWNNDFRNTDIHFLHQGIFGIFITPMGELRICEFCDTTVKAISPYYKAHLDSEGIQTSPDLKLTCHDDCVSSQKNYFIFSHFYE